MLRLMKPLTRHVGLTIIVIGLAILCWTALLRPALSQTKETLPTGKQYLVGQLAAAEAKVSDMLDEIASLKRERDALRDMMLKREKPKE